MRTSRAAMITGILVIALLVSLRSGFSQISQQDSYSANLSSGRGFGVGITLSVPPGIFLEYCFSDRLGLQASGGYSVGVVYVGGALKYRFLDARAFDLLMHVNGGFLGGSVMGFSYGGIIAGGGVGAEYSITKHLALNASLGISYYLFSVPGVIGVGNLLPSYGFSLTYYF